jgi:hypothetical protein
LCTCGGESVRLFTFTFQAFLSSPLFLGILPRPRSRAAPLSRWISRTIPHLALRSQRASFRQPKFQRRWIW